MVSTAGSTARVRSPFRRPRGRRGRRGRPRRAASFPQSPARPAVEWRRAATRRSPSWRRRAPATNSRAARTVSAFTRGLYFCMPRSLAAAAIAAAAVALGAIAWIVAGRTGAASFERRADQNVLLITIDTLRADALSSYGGPAKTPNLDALAAAGTRFDFAHAHAVLTRPSHASILTGTYPFQHGVRDHSGYRLETGAADDRHDAQGQGLCDGRVRRRRAARTPLRARPRFRRLRRSFRAHRQQLRLHAGRTSRRRSCRRRAEMDSADGRDAGSPGCTCSTRTRRTRRRRRSTRSTPAGLYYGEVAYVDKALGPLLDAAAHRQSPDDWSWSPAIMAKASAITAS